MRANIGAMHNHIDGQQQTETDDFFGDRALSCGSVFVAGDVIGRGLITVLDGNLHVIETCVSKHGKILRSQSNCRCYEIAVETGFARGRDDLG